MKNSRTTIAKTSILDLLIKSEIALAQQEIQQELGDLCNRVTTYRVLDRLIEEDLIHKVIDSSGIAKFMACKHEGAEHDHNHHHLHFSCKVCQHVSCLNHVVPKFNLPQHYSIEEYNLSVSGVCPNCQP